MANRTSAMRYLKKMTNSLLEVVKSSLRDLILILRAAPEYKVEVDSDRRITNRRVIQAEWWWREIYKEKAAARWQPSTRIHPKASCTPVADMSSRRRL